MASTINRLSQGVHERELCGKNTSGFAAIESSSTDTEFHILNDMLFGMSPSITTTSSKKKMLSCDSIAYIFMKVIMLNPSCMHYTLLLRKNTILSSCITSMISSLALSGVLVLIVLPVESTYTVTSYFQSQKATIMRDTYTKVKTMLSSMNCGKDSVYIVHPEMTDEYLFILNGLKDSIWCIPSFKTKSYISSHGREYYSNYALPWSGQHQCRGFTIGTGNIRIGSNSQQKIYTSSFGFYERFISCTPYKGSCPDCFDMLRVSRQIESMIHGKSKHIETRNMRPESIEALDNMKDMLAKMLGQ